MLLKDDFAFQVSFTMKHDFIFTIKIEWNPPKIPFTLKYSAHRKNIRTLF